MIVITTGSIPKALWPGVKGWWGMNYTSHDLEYLDLFEKTTSEQAYEEYVQVTDFPLAPVKAQGSATTYAGHQQGFTTRVTNIQYGLGFIVTYEELKNNLYMKVAKRRTASLAFSFRTTKETVGANLYNRAFSSSYTFGDGKELLATDHPNTSGGTWSNELAVAADFSQAALEDLIIQIMGATTDSGHAFALKPQCLIVPRQLWFEANRVVKSVLQSDTANNAINVIQSTNALPQGIKMNHYLTDADAWFVRTNIPKESGLIYQEREAMVFDTDNDFDTKNFKAKGYEDYAFSVVDPRALYGSAGS